MYFNKSFILISCIICFFYAGQSDCVRRGGELAIINNSEVQERLFNLTSSLQHKIDVWIGLHDLYQEGRWEWVDGKMCLLCIVNVL